MEQEVMLRRNAVFDLMYRKSMTAYVMCVPTALRWLIEVALILMAAGVLALWGYVHFRYIENPGDCLQHITERPLPYDVILQVEAFTNSTHLWGRRERAIVDLYQSIHKHEFTTELGSENINQSPQTKDSETRLGLGSNICEYLAVFGFKICCNSRVRDVTQGYELDLEPVRANTSNSKFLVTKHHHTGTDNNGSAHDQLYHAYAQDLDFKEDIGIYNHGNVAQDMRSLADNQSLFELLDFYTLKRHAVDYMILEFAQEPGYLSLTHSSRKKLNITIMRTYIDPENCTCFGGPFGRFISKYFLGYDMMIIASFKNFLPPGHASGFVRNLMTGEHYYYRVQWMGKWRYGAGLLPALFFTLVASILLRQIHYNLFNFLTHFHHMLNEGIPMPIQIGAQLPFLIVTYASIGFIIVMSEALSDDSVFSLLMMATVWEADQYYAVFCTQEASKKYFPWFFYLYHFLPYAYYIRFNGQFWFIPFMFHWFLLQHTMMFFIHHFEAPAFTLPAPDAWQHPEAEEPRIEHIYEEFHQNAGHGEPSENESELSEDESGGLDSENSPRQLSVAEVQNYRTTERSITRSERSLSAQGIEPFSTQECGSGGPSIMVSGNENETSLGSNLRVHTRLQVFPVLNTSGEDDDA